VIVAFTKCDAQEIKAINQLRQAGQNRRQAYQEAPSHVEAYLQGLEAKIKKTDHPPSAFVWLKSSLLWQKKLESTQLLTMISYRHEPARSTMPGSG
jgi:hypothetical protein